MAVLHEMVADHASDAGKVVVGIETDRGLWVGALVGAGYQVYAINPKAVSRYRDRHRADAWRERNQTDGDAKLLADLVRTDRHNHRPTPRLPVTAPGRKVIKIVARATIRTLRRSGLGCVTQTSCETRYASIYPAALETFGDLANAAGSRQLWPS